MSALYVPSLTHPRLEGIHGKVTKVLSGTDAEQITTERRLVAAAIISGKQGNNTDNAGDVFLGWDSTDQPIPIAPGQYISVQQDGNGMLNNLEKLWLRGASGDGVVINYIQA